MKRNQVVHNGAIPFEMFPVLGQRKYEQKLVHRKAKKWNYAALKFELGKNYLNKWEMKIDRYCVRYD